MKGIEQKAVKMKCVRTKFFVSAPTNVIQRPSSTCPLGYMTKHSYILGYICFCHDFDKFIFAALFSQSWDQRHFKQPL